MLRILLQYTLSPLPAARLWELRPEGMEIRQQPWRLDVRLKGIAAWPTAEADVLWHVLEPVTADLLASLPRLRLIQKIGTGVNTIDLDAARSRGIAVCNMPGTNTTAVAELSLLLMLAVLRRLPHLHGSTAAGRGWADGQVLPDPLGELAGRTVGLVGCGTVPRRLTPALLALGARVLYWSRSPKPDALGEAVSLERLLGDSDIVSLHLPIAADTARIIDAAALARMRDGAILINTARGGLVDEPALVAALRSGRLRGAGLDVFALEPVAEDHPLTRLPNVVLSPHVAWLTPETLDRSFAVALENCRRLAAAEPLLHQVVSS